MSNYRRAPVQADYGRSPRPEGTISWEEHELAWRAYDAKYRCGQSADTVARRGGFSYSELVSLLGRAPETWQER